MPSYNLVILIGHLTRDAELKFTAAGVGIANGGIAVNETWKDANGEKKEKVCFVDFAVIGKRAEIFVKYTKKGDPIQLVGVLQFDQWEKEGQKRSKHTIKVNDFTFLLAKDKGGSDTEMPSEADIPF